MNRFTARLLNGSFGDAALLLENAQSKDRFLFDMGDLHTLSAKTLMQVSHVFVTHTHIDHFAGFEQLLRQNLSRPTPLYLFGPPGFISQVKAKLQGFTWNLIQDPCYTLEIIVTEVRPRGLLRQRFCSRNAFKPQKAEKLLFNGGVLLNAEHYTVECAFFDHGTPCLGFCLTEKERCHIDTTQLAALKLKDGPWLKNLLTAISTGQPKDTPLAATLVDGGEGLFKLGDLQGRITTVSPPYKVAYITDLAYTKPNVNKAVKLARAADMLFIEAAFINADSAHAAAKHHLTTGQAAAIIELSRAKAWTLFHFSHKYQKNEDQVWQEVREALAANGPKGKPPEGDK